MRIEKLEEDGQTYKLIPNFAFNGKPIRIHLLSQYIYIYYLILLEIDYKYWPYLNKCRDNKKNKNHNKVKLELFLVMDGETPQPSNPFTTKMVY